VRTNVVGLIEGVAEATSSLLKVFSGWFSDRIGARKSPAVAGYALSAFAKPLFYFASTWQAVAVARWGDRVGKGIRTAPRDALVADSIAPSQRGLAFGFHRGADTAGAVVGLSIALGVVVAASSTTLTEATWQRIVLLSLIPAALAVLALAVGARETGVKERRARPSFALRSLGKPFMIFLGIVALFDLGNSSDAFLVLRAQSLGANVAVILAMLITFNLVYAVVSAPAGALSDRIGRERLLIGGWVAYALIYLGFAFAQQVPQAWALFALYGLYYGTAYGTAKAFVADLVPAQLRGTAYGTYAAVLGLLDLPASLIAGVLWGGVGRWAGFGPRAPFLFGGMLALAAALLMALWRRSRERGASVV
jgi:MFS family permease